MALEDYTDFAQAAQPPGMPPMAPDQMLSEPQQMMAPEPAPLAPRLPADKLLAKYTAWEQAKDLENQEAYAASRYYHGKQWSDSELKALKKRKQPATVKNRIKRKVDFLVGIEQSQRRDPKGVPRNPAGEKAAYVGTASLRYVADVNKAQVIFSDGASDGLIRGIGVSKGVAQRVKDKVEIRKQRVSSDRWFYDPRSERWDFDDSLYFGEAAWIDIDQAKEMLPFAADRIESLATHAISGGSSTGPLPQFFDKDRQWCDPNSRRLFLIEMWYKYQGNWMFDFLVGAQSLCPDGEDGQSAPMDCLSPYTNEDGETVSPYDPWSPYVDERGDRYGVVRDMMPIQDEINKRSSKALHALTVRQTKGQRGAVDDIDKMKAELAKPDGHVEYNPGFEFDVLEQTAVVQGNLELLQEAKAEIENLGPNPGLVGRGVEKQSGRAILAQQNSGMTELSPVFERIREWKLRCYRRDWNMIRQFWNSERTIRVSGDPEAMQHLMINRPVVNPQTGQVMGVENSIAEIDIDIILDEGPDTVTMREELMEQLSQLGPGVVPPELLIELSNIGEKDQLLRKMQEFKAPPPEIEAMQKRMAQLEELMAAVNVDKAQADVENKRAATAKTLAEIGLPPQAMAQAFPFYYREPTTLDEAKAMMGGQPPQGMPPNALAGPQGPPMGPDGPMGPGGMPPPNELGGPPQGPPDGLDGAIPPPPIGQDFLEASSTPWVQ
jgi:hypothetical protein